jgi:hypothetical protein
VSVFKPKSRAGLDACVGFYGLDGNRDRARAFYEATLVLLNRLNEPPTTLVVRRGGRSNRATSFRVGDRRFKQEGFEPVNAFTLAVCPGDASALMLDADIECEWTEEGWALLVARSVLADFDNPSLREWLRASVAALRPEYGIGYYRPRRLASALYVIGMGFSFTGEPPQESREEIRRRKRWGSDGMEDAVWRQGILRDVYPLHILTKPQLDRPVGVLPLRDWIMQESARGSLTELVKGWWLWEVPNEGAEPVRQALQDAGALFQPPPEEPDD